MTELKMDFLEHVLTRKACKSEKLIYEAFSENEVKGNDVVKP